MLRLHRIAPRFARLHGEKPSVVAKRLYVHRVCKFSTLKEAVQQESDHAPCDSWHALRDNLRAFKKRDTSSPEKEKGPRHSSLDFVSELDNKLRTFSTDNMSPAHTRLHGIIADLYERRYKDALEEEGLCEQKIIDNRIDTWTTER